MPKHFNRYCEPFLGGGALFFDLAYPKALVNDVNCELINFYEVVKNDVGKLIETIQSFEDNEEFFYQLRVLDRDKEKFSKFDKTFIAARTYYLNRRCFNGLYRVTKKGYFNAPYGHYKTPLPLDIDNFKRIAEYLNQNEITICSKSYLELENMFEDGDFVYFDPPYDNAFTQYHNSGFDYSNQQELKLLCDRLTELDIKFMLSNSATDFILDLYKDYKCNLVTAKRNINSNASGRNGAKEVIITNY